MSVFKFTETVEVSVVHTIKFLSRSFIMLCVEGGLTLVFTSGSTCKPVFSSLSNSRWKTHTTVIWPHMPLIHPP